jgi:uncharacterized protein involved in exopolysaccharide biosynthesis
MHTLSQDDAIASDSRAELMDLWSLVLQGRWIVIIVTLLCCAAGGAYAILATKWYRAEVLLVPASNDARNGLLSQFGGLASLAGISLGSRDDTEPLAVLKSKGFARSFIVEQGLVTVLLASKWDPRIKQWKGPAQSWPDERDAVKIFDEKVRRVIEDRKTGLVTLAVEWKDPLLAAQWASLLAQKLNAQMRERAIREANANIGYLKAEIAANDLVALQQPIGRLLELEQQKLMLARSNTQYSFRVVDEAQIPKRPIRPKRLLVIAMSALIGAFLSLLILLAMRAAGARKS